MPRTTGAIDVTEQIQADPRHERRAAGGDRRLAALRGLRASCSRPTATRKSACRCVEHTELFKRSIGEHTDIVEKEMYTFTDRGGDSLTLRPEATAGIVRALISNGLLRGAAPQALVHRPDVPPRDARRRAATGSSIRSTSRRSASPGPDVDAELIALDARGCGSGSGSRACDWRSTPWARPRARREYRERLVEYFRAHEARAG